MYDDAPVLMILFLFVVIITGWFFYYIAYKKRREICRKCGRDFVLIFGRKRSTHRISAPEKMIKQPDYIDRRNSSEKICPWCGREN